MAAENPRRVGPVLGVSRPVARRETRWRKSRRAGRWGLQTGKTGSAENHHELGLGVFPSDPFEGCHGDRRSTPDDLLRDASRPMSMTKRSADVSWLMRGVALGQPTSGAALLPLFDAYGIDSLVDCHQPTRVTPADCARASLAFLPLAWDADERHRVAQLDRGVSWMDGRIEAGGKVLIVSDAERIEGPLLGACYLVHRGHTPLEAFEQLKRARPEISPSPSQLEVFRVWSRHQLARRQTSWTVPPFMQLAKIAYSHLRMSGTGV